MVLPYFLCQNANVSFLLFGAILSQVLVRTRGSGGAKVQNVYFRIFGYFRIRYIF